MAQSVHIYIITSRGDRDSRPFGSRCLPACFSALRPYQAARDGSEWPWVDFDFPVKDFLRTDRPKNRDRRITMSHLYIVAHACLCI